MNFDNIENFYLYCESCGCYFGPGIEKCPLCGKKLKFKNYYKIKTNDPKSISLSDLKRFINKDEFRHTTFETIVVPKSIKWIGPTAFYKSKVKNIILPFGLEEIGPRAFAESHIKSIVIPPTVKKIAYSTFEDCAELEYVDLGRVEVIEDYAFSKCPIKVLKMSKNLKKIGYQAFLLSKIETLIFPDSLEEIGASAFDGDENLRQVYIGKTCSIFGSEKVKSIFAGTYIEHIETTTQVNWHGPYGWRVDPGPSYIKADRFPNNNLICYGEKDSFFEQYCKTYKLKFENTDKLDSGLFHFSLFENFFVKLQKDISDLDNQIKNKQDEILSYKDSHLSDLLNQQKKLNKEEKLLRKKLDSVGFFHLKEKKLLKNELFNIDCNIAEVKKEVYSFKNYDDEVVKNIKKEIKSLKTQQNKLKDLLKLTFN